VKNVLHLLPSILIFNVLSYNPVFIIRKMAGPAIGITSAEKHATEYVKIKCT
jgi:hypothetical protein